MPRKKLPSRKAKTAIANLRLESSRRMAVVARREHNMREAALALRLSTPDWVDMSAQIQQLQLEVEMDAMEAAIDERRPKVPILNFDVMAGFKSPEVKRPSHATALSAPEKEKAWKYPGHGDNPRPQDDWRNYE